MTGKQTTAAQTLKVLLMIGFAANMAAITGCAAKKTPQQLFAECRYAEADRALQPLIPEESHQNYILFQAMHASAAYEAGNYLSAQECLRTVRDGMETIGGEGEAAAVIGSEYSKTYRGDPFEKCMAHMYGGFLYLKSGQTESALASFRQSLAADQETRTEDVEKTKDFATGHYFAAVAYELLDEPDNARVHLEHAEHYAGPSDMFSMDSLDRANVFILIETDCGPVKATYGPGHSMVQYVKPAEMVSAVSFTCDGNTQGNAVLLDDLMDEAQAHGWGEMDSARLAKGIAKEVLAQIPIVGILNCAIRSEADARIWQFLPGKNFLWAGYVEPGLHTFALHCQDAKGKHLDCCDQVWFYVPVKPEERNFLSFRIVPYRQNIREKVLVPCSIRHPQEHAATISHERFCRLAE